MNRTRPSKWPARRPASRARLVSALGLSLIAAGLGGCDRRQESQDCAPEARAHTVTGYCIPRWASLTHNRIAARKGPGTDYPVLWEYHVRDLPVQIIGETLEWRRICDPDGGAVWVKRTAVTGKRFVLSLPASPAIILAEPRDGAALKGYLRSRALAALDRCQGEWCRVKAGGVSGWARAAGLWGVAQTAQCR